jgi:hypothetical protein
LVGTLRGGEGYAFSVRQAPGRETMEGDLRQIWLYRRQVNADDVTVGMFVGKVDGPDARACAGVEHAAKGGRVCGARKELVVKG